eukprot:624807-Karenia_brevis.AAC.1
MSYFVTSCLIMWPTRRGGKHAQCPRKSCHVIVPKKTYISQGEALAPFLCFVCNAALLKGGGIFAFVDNIGVLSAFATGSSGVPDFNSIINALHLILASLDVIVWFERVDSSTHIADAGTRIAPSAKEYKRLHIP